MQIGGQINGGRENTLAVLALGLAVELLPPFGHEAERGLVGSQDFNVFAVRVQRLTAHGVLHGSAFHTALQRILTLGLCTVHERFNVDAAAGDGKQAHSRQNGIAAADIIGHNKAFIALTGRKRLQRTARLVCRGVNTALCTLHAVFLLERSLKNAERDGRLGRRAGFGNDVHGKIAVADHGEDLRHSVGGNAVAGEINVRGVLGQSVVVRTLQQFNHGARAEIAAADANDDKRLGVRLDLLCRSLNAGELFPVVVYRQVDPADEVIACAGTVYQCVKRSLCRGLVRLAGIKLLRAFKIDAYHIDRSFYDEKITKTDARR